MNTRTRNTRSITIWSSRNSSSLHSSRIEFMCRQRQAQMHTILMVIIPFHRASSSKPSTIDWYVSVYLMGCHNCTRNSWISVRMRFTDTDAFCFNVEREMFLLFSFLPKSIRGMRHQLNSSVDFGAVTGQRQQAACSQPLGKWYRCQQEMWFTFNNQQSLLVLYVCVCEATIAVRAWFEGGARLFLSN